MYINGKTIYCIVKPNSPVSMMSLVAQYIISVPSSLRTLSRIMSSLFTSKVTSCRGHYAHIYSTISRVIKQYSHSMYYRSTGHLNLQPIRKCTVLALPISTIIVIKSIVWVTSWISCKGRCRSTCCLISTPIITRHTLSGSGSCACRCARA